MKVLSCSHARTPDYHELPRGQGYYLVLWLGSSSRHVLVNSGSLGITIGLDSRGHSRGPRLR